MKLGAAALAIAAVLGSHAAAAAQDARAALVEGQEAAAPARLSQAGADPWTVESSAALFGRPSFWEAFKLTNDTTTENRSTYGVTASLAGFVGPRSPYLDGLQLTAAAEVTDRVGFVGVKWNLDLRDVRLLSDARVAAIGRAIDDEIARCRPPDVDTPELQRAFAACIEGAFTRRFTPALDWRPAFAIGAAAGFDADDRRWAERTATAAAELSGGVGPTTLAITVNGEVVRHPASADGPRSTQAGGGVQLAETFTLWRPWTIAVGGKVLGCASATCGDHSTLALVLALSVRVSDKQQLGTTLRWEGAGGDLRAAIVGVSFSSSFTRGK